MTDSVLAHLARSFAASEENIATEALAFILSSSPDARVALLEFLKQLGLPATDTLKFHAQVTGSDGERPDLVAVDPDGNEVLLVEVKFAAGLTDNQPVSYLRRLPPGATLLFVCPGKRSTILWAELARRCHAAEIPLMSMPRAREDTWVAAAGGNNHLVLTSWRELLTALAPRDPSASADVAQLRGLCDRWEDELFLPVSSEELTDQVYQRVFEFSRLADELHAALYAERLVPSGKYGSGFAWSGRWFSLPGVHCFLGFSLRRWLTTAATPFWFAVYGPTSLEKPEGVRTTLASLERTSPPRLFATGDRYNGWDGYTVALFVPTNVDKRFILDALVVQVSEVLQLLNPQGTAIESGAIMPGIDDLVEPEATL